MRVRHRAIAAVVVTVSVLSAGWARAAADGPPPSTGPATTHKFSYAAAPGAAAPAAVSVAGDFNGWSTTATPLAKGKDGAFAARVPVAAGRHQYKFVVDGTWVNDPKADAALDAPDGLGGKNSGFDTTATPAGPPPKYTFRFQPFKGQAVATVTVAGDFNNWSTTANPLQRQTDGSFVAEVDVPVGRHQYKLVVDGNWTPDPKADKSLETEDGHGGKNSGIDVKSADE